MTRRLLAPLFVLAVMIGLVAQAADPQAPAKKPADVTKKKVDGDKLTPEQIEAAQKEAALKEDQLKRQFDEVKQMLLRLAQRLDSSPKPEDRDKAKILREALNATSTQTIDAKLIALAAALKGSGAFSDLDQLSTLIKENNDLRTELRALIDLLLKDNRDAELKRQREETEKLLEKLKEVIAKQERHRTQVEMGRRDNKDLAKEQRTIKENTKDLYDPNRKSDKGAEAKGEGKGAGKDSKEARGEGKDDTKGPKGTAKEEKGGEGKSAEGKDGKSGEGKDGKSGEGKDGKQGEGKGGEGKDGKSGEGKDGKSGEGKDGKQGEGKAGESKDGKQGEGKDGKSGEGKQGEPKSGEGKPGSPKEGKPSDGKGGEGKPSDAKSGAGKQGEGKGGKQGEPKSGQDSKGRGEGKGEGKPGQPSDGKSGQPNQGKQGEGKGGQSQQGQQGQPGEGKGEGDSGGKSPPPSNQQPQEITQAKKKIRDATDKQDSAEKNLDKNKKPEAVEDEDQAVARLKEAQKKLEDLLRQLREEEAERLLAQLQSRCERMRAMQIAVRDATINIDKAIQNNADKKPSRADAQSSNVQSDKEEEIVKEANNAIKLIETEGTAVAFAEVFRQVRGDMMNVRDRLRRTDVGVVTVAIENQIIDDLGDMIEALKKARQDNKNRNQQQQQQQQSGPPPDPRLLDVLQELKLILARQKRVNARTELYGKQYPDEQAITRTIEGLPPEERERAEMLLKELKELAEQQGKLSKVTDDIAKGKNKAN
jgi:hypothetical protein